MDKEGKEQFYHYVVVVFGLGPAGQALGRVMRPILTYLYLLGIRIMIYVDDGRTAAGSKQQADSDYATTIRVFTEAGFTVAEEKLDKLGDSAQRKEYLAFVIDTNKMSVHVPEQKLVRVLQLLGDFLKARDHRVRDIASVVGKLISLEPALGRSVLIGTRLATIAIVVATEAAKKRANPWSKTIRVEDYTFAALYDVWKLAEGWNGCPIRYWHTGFALLLSLPMGATASLDQKIPARRIHDRRAVMARDASDFAVASYSVEGLPEFSFSDKLSLEEKGELSSTRELLAIQRTFQLWITEGAVIGQPLV
jgi:hypothetical protein